MVERAVEGLLLDDEDFALFFVAVRSGFVLFPFIRCDVIDLRFESDENVLVDVRRVEDFAVGGADDVFCYVEHGFGESAAVCPEAVEVLPLGAFACEVVCELVGDDGEARRVGRELDEVLPSRVLSGDSPELAVDGYFGFLDFECVGEAVDDFVGEVCVDSLDACFVVVLGLGPVHLLAL